VTFVNRQSGAGTRILLDLKLAEAGVLASDVRGYDLEVYTHSAVAASVAAGTAHTGLGIAASAAAFGLDFVPIDWEEYDLVVPEDLLADRRVEAVVDVIRSEAFRIGVESLGGYDASSMGVEITRVPSSPTPYRSGRC
jgi:putative molybdopterin biosynthesis protein